MGDFYRAALPYIICDLLVLTAVIALPGLALWLPGLSRG